MKFSNNRIFICAAGLLLVLSFAQASERHFGYSYESAVLPEGDKELETYSTFRFGRDHFYSALDQRLEWEVGLGDGVQTSLYMNFTQEMEDQGGGQISNNFLVDGVSNEWKFKLKDSLTEDFGLGLYAEAGFKPDELELETKIILDKSMGNWLWTLNLTSEPEYHLVDNSLGCSFIPSLGVGCFLVSERFFLGLEVQNDNFYEGQSLPLTRSILSAGPVLSFTDSSWWATLTFLPQLANLRAQSLDFQTSQRMQVRLAASFSIGDSPSPKVALLPEPGGEKSQGPGDPSNSSLADLKWGRNLCLQHCGACHSLHSPSEFTREGWKRIVEKMQVKAKLGEDEKKALLSYLIRFSKDSGEKPSNQPMAKSFF
jgi:hypothetical protein